MNAPNGHRYTLCILQGKGYSRDGWEVEVDLVDGWLKEIDDDTYDQVVAALRILTEHGPALGRPLVDSVAGSRHKNMKELRPGSSGRSEVRILFAFDPKRRAILLLAGDKQGVWSKWYRKNLPVADGRYDEHLANLKKGGQ